jgi:hypothetical protein
MKVEIKDKKCFLEFVGFDTDGFDELDTERYTKTIVEYMGFRSRCLMNLGFGLNKYTLAYTLWLSDIDIFQDMLDTMNIRQRISIYGSTGCFHNETIIKRQLAEDILNGKVVPIKNFQFN